ncbi:MAG: hypothetical protein ABI130_03265 [Leifsonia sp.]
MRVFIPEDIVVDGDLPTPQPGVVLPLMAVRLHDGLDRGDHTTIDGTITWARYDTLSGLVEALISTREVDVFTKSFGQESDLAIVDTITSQTGLLWCIRPYEFDAFDLPDIRRPWLVTRSSADTTVGGSSTTRGSKSMKARLLPRREPQPGWTPACTTFDVSGVLRPPRQSPAEW